MTSAVVAVPPDPTDRMIVWGTDHATLNVTAPLEEFGSGGFGAGLGFDGNSLSAGKLLGIQNRTGIDGTFLFETTVGFYTPAIFVDTIRLKNGSGTNSQMARRVLRTIGS